MKYLQQLLAALTASLGGGRPPALTPVSVRSRQRERGASLVEYALLVALIALVCIGAVTLLGTELDEKYSSVSGELD